MKTRNKTYQSALAIGLMGSLLVLSLNTETAYAFQSKALDCAFTYLPILAISVIWGVISLIITFKIIFSTGQDKLIEILKLWIVPVVLFFIAFIFASEC